jgi:hypothetical protein
MTERIAESMAERMAESGLRALAAASPGGRRARMTAPRTFGSFTQTSQNKPPLPRAFLQLFEPRVIERGRE